MRAARVHHAARRRGGGVAARGAGAAARAGAARRRAYEPGRGRCGRAGPQHCLRAGASATGLGRRPKPSDRTSLGCGRCRPHPQIRRRTGRAHSGCHTDHWRCRRGTVAASNPHGAGRIRACSRSGRLRLRRQLGAPGRQRDRICPVRIRHQWKMAGAAQGNRAGRGTRSSPSRPCHCRGPGPGRRDPGGGAVIWHGGDPNQCARHRRDGARHRGFRAHLARRPDRDRQRVDGVSSRSDCHAGGPVQAAHGLCPAPLCRQWRLDLLWG